MPARICSGSSPPRMASNCRTRSLIPSIPFSFTESTKASSRPICWMTFFALPMISNRSVDMGPIRRCGGWAFPHCRGPEKREAWREPKGMTSESERRPFIQQARRACLRIAWSPRAGPRPEPLEPSDTIQTLLPKKWSRNRPQAVFLRRKAIEDETGRRWEETGSLRDEWAFRRTNGQRRMGRSVGLGSRLMIAASEVCPGAESDVAFEGDLATLAVCRRRVVV